ncbi:MAG: hypothetical protein DVB32_07820 [Verrucomicrobia bacterium]|nr:MAG: hypothetical protein DVB32_07820 [Verrucomicrobiota bacterium]
MPRRSPSALSRQRHYQGCAPITLYAVGSLA